MNKTAEVTTVKAKKIAAWILENFKPTQKVNEHHSSYGLKHLCERDIGVYVSHLEFTAVAITLGITAVEIPNSPNYHFCMRWISQKKRREAGSKPNSINQNL